MPKCSYCGSLILFGGKKVNEFIFCNEKCSTQGILLQISHHIPAELTEKTVREVHSGTSAMPGKRSR